MCPAEHLVGDRNGPFPISQAGALVDIVRLLILSDQLPTISPILLQWVVPRM